MFEVRQADCHDTCLDVEGPDGHVANVNPVSDTDPQVWRVDCDGCGTCVRAGFKTKRAARAAAIAHVRISVDEFLSQRYADYKGA